jgi:Kef-type K+ transport system membrane component KefB
MPALHFTNLLIVVAAGLVAPLALGFFPRLRIPSIVLEIVLRIVIGPSVLGWVKGSRSYCSWRVLSSTSRACEGGFSS